MRPRTGLGAFTAAFAACIALLAAQDHATHSQGQMEQIHRDSEAYIAMLESSRRDDYQKPEEVVAALALEPGEVIADIGAGSGYFSFRFARKVGEAGRIYAVDVNPDMIRHLNRRIGELGIRNVIPHLSEPGDPLLVGNSIDRVFICNTWHHIENQQEYLHLLKQALKPDGQVIMLDFKKEELPVGPPLGMKISRTDLLSRMEAGGFRLVEEHTFLPYQYFLIFAPRD